MKITKQQLRRIVKEEKDKLLNESIAIDRTIGLYFDVMQQKTAFDALTKLFNDAVGEAIEDGYEDEEAVADVAAGVRKVFENWLSKTAIYLSRKR